MIDLEDLDVWTPLELRELQIESFELPWLDFAYMHYVMTSEMAQADETLTQMVGAPPPELFIARILVDGVT